MLCDGGGELRALLVPPVGQSGIIGKSRSKPLDDDLRVLRRAATNRGIRRKDGGILCGWVASVETAEFLGRLFTESTGHMAHVQSADAPCTRRNGCRSQEACQNWIAVQNTRQPKDWARSRVMCFAGCQHVAEAQHL